MKIAIAQYWPVAGKILENIEKHLSFVQEASCENADFIVFPELSLTGYEPKLAQALAIHADDIRLDVFQQQSDASQIVIGIGVPLRTRSGVEIAMVLFQPSRPRTTYSKQYLHSDELPYFSEGGRGASLMIEGKEIALAICYESLLMKHAKDSLTNGAVVYVTSVAKSSRGIAKAFAHYPVLAKRFSVPVLMSNSVGPSDDFTSAGTSSHWDASGALVESLSESGEDILYCEC